MASATIPYDESLHLVDYIEEYQYWLHTSSYTRSPRSGQGGDLKARVCPRLGEQMQDWGNVHRAPSHIGKEYSLPPLLQRQNGGAEGRQEQEWAGIETDSDQGGEQEDGQQGGQEEEVWSGPARAERGLFIRFSPAPKDYCFSCGTTVR